jgi:hypothetical protein
MQSESDFEFSYAVSRGFITASIILLIILAIGFHGLWIFGILTLNYFRRLNTYFDWFVYALLRNERRVPVSVREEFEGL